jgi:hypothetical protein
VLVLATSWWPDTGLWWVAGDFGDSNKQCSGWGSCRPALETERDYSGWGGGGRCSCFVVEGSVASLVVIDSGWCGQRLWWWV